MLGPPDARVTLVEYGDFECPFCGRAYPELKRVLVEVRPKVRFVFRHFPMGEQHPHAEHAAEVAEAAAAQGKFWEMHDLLYQRQAALADDDFMSGVRSGVSGTPMFFINGQRHEEPGDTRTLAAALRRAL